MRTIVTFNLESLTVKLILLVIIINRHQNHSGYILSVLQGHLI